MDWSSAPYNRSDLSSLLVIAVKKVLLTLTAISAGLAAAAPAALSQQQCYQVAAFVAPSQLKCQQVGTDYLGKPIWLCCN